MVAPRLSQRYQRNATTLPIQGLANAPDLGNHTADKVKDNATTPATIQFAAVRPKANGRSLRHARPNSDQT